jgi:hypothetical protein
MPCHKMLVLERKNHESKQSIFEILEINQKKIAISLQSMVRKRSSQSATLFALICYPF